MSRASSKGCLVMPAPRTRLPTTFAAPWRAATDPLSRYGPDAPGLVAGIVALPLLVFALLRVSAWAGHAIMVPGAWAESDLGLFRSINGGFSGSRTPLLFLLLNDPGLVYLVLTAVLLVTLAVVRRGYLLPAALGVGTALWLNQLASQEAHLGGFRLRPYAIVAEAQTPIQSCVSLAMVGSRGNDGPSASCAAPAKDEPPPEIQGIDWREIWSKLASFPSGHVRETVAISIVFLAVTPRPLLALPFLVLFNLVLGYSRILLGAHYPTDVLFGAVMGAWSGGIVALGLDVIRRAARLLYRVPEVARVWDWTFATRVAGRPDLDPPPARLIRIALLLGGAHVGLAMLGFAANSPRAGHVYTLLQDVDSRGVFQLAYKFEPAFAPGLYAALGPAGAVYPVLAGAALLSALINRWRSVPATALALALAALLALEIAWVGGALFPRPLPLVQQPEIPVPEEWRVAWQAGSSFPSRHALLLGALAGVLAAAWWLLAIPAQVLATLAAATAVYFGVAWLTDVLAGLVIGNALAGVARYAVGQFLPARKRVPAKDARSTQGDNVIPFRKRPAAPAGPSQPISRPPRTRAS